MENINNEYLVLKEVTTEIFKIKKKKEKEMHNRAADKVQNKSK